MFSNVICRFFFHFSIDGSEELGELAVMVIAFIGGAIAYPRGEHVAVEILYKILPEHWHQPLKAEAAWVVVITAAVAAILAVQIVFITTIKNKTGILGINKGWYSLPMIIGFLLIGGRRAFSLLKWWAAT